MQALHLGLTLLLPLCEFDWDELRKARLGDRVARLFDRATKAKELCGPGRRPSSAAAAGLYDVPENYEEIPGMAAMTPVPPALPPPRSPGSARRSTSALSSTASTPIDLNPLGHTPQPASPAFNVVIPFLFPGPCADGPGQPIQLMTVICAGETQRSSPDEDSYAAYEVPRPLPPAALKLMGEHM